MHSGRRDSRGTLVSLSDVTLPGGFIYPKHFVTRSEAAVYRQVCQIKGGLSQKNEENAIIGASNRGRPAYASVSLPTDCEGLE